MPEVRGGGVGEDFVNVLAPEPTVMNRISIAVNNMSKEKALKFLLELEANVQGLIKALRSDIEEGRTKWQDRA